jgi:hypothetical protein
VSGSEPILARSERAIGYRDYFNAHTRRLAEDMFSEDTETFGYKF